LWKIEKKEAVSNYETASFLFTKRQHKSLSRFCENTIVINEQFIKL